MYHFQSIVCDFSQWLDAYAATAERYSNWLSIIRLLKELINTMWFFFENFGICEILLSDEAIIFTDVNFGCSKKQKGFFLMGGAVFPIM